MSIILTLIPTKISSSGQQYDVFLGDERIVHNKRSPGHEACRELVKRGFSGEARFFDKDGKPRFSFSDIVETAKWRLVEQSSGSPTFIIKPYLETGHFDDG